MNGKKTFSFPEEGVGAGSEMMKGRWRERWNVGGNARAQLGRSACLPDHPFLLPGFWISIGYLRSFHEFFLVFANESKFKGTIFEHICNLCRYLLRTIRLFICLLGRKYILTITSSAAWFVRFMFQSWWNDWSHRHMSTWSGQDTFAILGCEFNLYRISFNKIMPNDFDFLKCINDDDNNFTHESSRWILHHQVHPPYHWNRRRTSLMEGYWTQSNWCRTVQVSVDHDATCEANYWLILCPYGVTFILNRAIYFCTYSSMKSFCNETFKTPDTPPVHICSAAAAGFVSCTATNPIWLVKTRLQLDQR